MQPPAASPEASYLLSLFHVIIDQVQARTRRRIPPRRHHYLPYAYAVEPEWNAFLALLANFATVNNDAQDRIPFAQPNLATTRSGNLLHGVGVRLRHGGARFPLVPTADGRVAIGLPGTHDDHDVTGHRQPPGTTPVAAPRRVLMVLNITAPSVPSDLILSVNKSSTGHYHTLRYVLRPQNGRAGAHGGGRPIGRYEWTEIRPMEDGVEPWMVCFFLNVMLRT